jgi:antitoxin component HigA of HigAB toxin-antitoxin module
MPWVFSQSHLLDTDSFIEEAGKRGVTLDHPALRELYRRGLLMPLVELTARQVCTPWKPDEPEPDALSGGLMLLRRARDAGRLRDLSAEPFKPRLAFEPMEQTPPFRWDGLVYSRYQLLGLPLLTDVLLGLTYQQRGTRRIARLPAPGPALIEHARHLRDVALALTALETRYLPKLDRDMIHLKNWDVDGWERYRAGFDPVHVRDWLYYPADRARADAEELLRLAADIDPLGPLWSELTRRASLKARGSLIGTALLAADLRTAAEILLLFYEDLAGAGQAEPLPDAATMQAGDPLLGRLSSRPRTLDENLIALGVSPHPRVVLVLEGDTEMHHAPLVQASVDLSDAPELIRPLKLGGVGTDLTKVAALAAAPLVGQKIPGSNQWNLIKPFTRLFIAIDPDRGYDTKEHVDRQRTKLLNEIKDVLKAQGVEHPSPDELEQLVVIRTWDTSCYEFAHFTDEELADSIMAVHDTIDGWTREELVAALGYWRDKSQDIKRVWESGRWDASSGTVTGRWEYEVSKTKLAEALWPALLGKIRECLASRDAPVPPIVRVVIDAYSAALRWRDASFVLAEVPAELVPQGS